MPASGAFPLPKQTVDCTGQGPDCAVTTTVSGPAAASAEKKRSVKLGGSSFTVKAGATGKVKVKLTKKELRQQKRANRIEATVVVSVMRGSARVTKTVRVTLKAPKRGRRWLDGSASGPGAR